MRGRIFDQAAALKATPAKQRAGLSQPAATRTHPAGSALLAVQQHCGNHYVQQVIQAKLVAGPAGDRYEREADRVAQRAVHGQNGPVTVTKRHPTAGQGQAATADTSQAIQRERGRGQALPERLRTHMERALGTDFGGVRLHNDAQADQLNRLLRARAFTAGQDVFLRRGEAGLSTDSGRALIAHELTHVVQQGQQGQAGAPVIQRKLVQIGGDPAHLEDDKTGVKATLKTGTTDIYVGDHDNQDYKIETDSVTNEQTFVLSKPTTGFFITSAPPTWNPPPITDYWESPRRQTTYSFSPGGHPYRRGTKGGKYSGGSKPTRRKAGGYVNPKQFETNMLPLWKASALSPIPSTVVTDDDFRDWVKKPARRLRVYSPSRNRTKDITGYKAGGTRSAVVLGHQPSAGSHFNTIGHTQPRDTNLSHNKSTGAYHGLEDSTWSAQSGASEPRYLSPRPDLGSHASYWNPSDPGYSSSGGPWSSYSLETELDMIAYIEGKLNAAATTASKDPEYQRAVIELGNIKTTYSAATVRELLGIIQKYGW